MRGGRWQRELTRVRSRRLNGRRTRKVFMLSGCFYLMLASWFSMTPPSCCRSLHYPECPEPELQVCHASSTPRPVRTDACIYGQWCQIKDTMEGGWAHGGGGVSDSRTLRRQHGSCLESDSVFALVSLGPRRVGASDCPAIANRLCFISRS